MKITMLIIISAFTLVSATDHPFQPQQESLKIKKIEILKMSKKENIKSKWYSKYSKDCADWNLSQDEMLKIMRTSKAINGHTFSYFFDVLPCSFEGEVMVNDSAKMEFEINAGSFTTVYNAKSSFYFGYYGKSKFFIKRPATSLE